jgi:hypothetical protein
MSGKVKLALLGVVAVAAGIAAFAATRGDASPDTAALSNRGGAAVRIRGLQLAGARITTGTVLGVRNGRALYRLNRAGGGAPCFGVGEASDLGNPGSVVCPRGAFPSTSNPVLDLSVYEGMQHDRRDFSLFRVEGVAADGVAAVQFFRPDGSVALSVPVTANVYATSRVPAGMVAGIAAVDKAGKRIWRSP